MAHANNPPRAVYRDFDQTELDAQYNNRARFPNYLEHFAAWQRWSAHTRTVLPSHLDLSFGPGPDETLDIFPAPAERGAAPLYVFIHGGYWYSLDKSDYSYVAEGFRPHGLATVVNNFGLAPRFTMDEIVAQNRNALAWLWRNARRYSADPSRIYVAGHSAGGHLAALLLATDWSALGADLPPDLVKGACAIGGIFDLEPIRRSFLNAKLHLTLAQVAAHSPLLQTVGVPAPLLLIVAKDESPEFHRQSAEMHARWESLGFPVQSVVPAGLDHFDVVNQLISPEAGLVAMQLDHIKQAFADV
jgi:arylformamidase